MLSFEIFFFEEVYEVVCVVFMVVLGVWNFVDWFCEVFFLFGWDVFGNFFKVVVVVLYVDVFDFFVFVFEGVFNDVSGKEFVEVVYVNVIVWGYFVFYYVFFFVVFFLMIFLVMQLVQ